MEFNFNCEKILNPDYKGFAIIDSCHKDILTKEKFEKMSTIIDKFGNLSSTVRKYITNRYS